MLIDVHTHCTRRRNDAPHPVGDRYACAADLLRVMNRTGVDKAVILPMSRAWWADPISPVADALESWRAFPDRFIPFCNFFPNMVMSGPRTDFRHLLRYFKERGCRGVGEYTIRLPFDDPHNMNVFAQVEEVRLPLTFHIAPAMKDPFYGCYDDIGLPRLEKVLKTFPKLILLGHSQPFWAEISTDVTPKNRNGRPPGKVTPGRVVELMRKYPNLHGDLSAGSGHNALSRDPEFGYRFMEEFQDRLHFGTDNNYVPYEDPVAPYFRKLKEERLISGRAYEKIAWKNSAKLFGI